jgi:hypothetical protein
MKGRSKDVLFEKKNQKFFLKFYLGRVLEAAKPFWFFFSKEASFSP